MKRLWILPVLVLALCPAVFADRTVSADAYLDKLKGMWLGELMGNYAGRPSEGGYTTSPLGNPSDTISWTFADATRDSANPWGGDDDTNLEYMAMTVIGSHPSVTSADVRTAWQNSVPSNSGAIYVANKQAKFLIDAGANVPQSGSINYNMHWYAIDSQITTESLGALSPGKRQRAADLAKLFGGATNDGYALHAAQYYSAMYAAAAFENTGDAATMERLVAAGQAVVPQTSSTFRIIQDVRDLYAADKADGTLDWRATRLAIYNKYKIGPEGRYRDWIESSINTALTTMCLLYGQGDFKETVRVGVLAGFDADCNPATAAGLVGMVRGFSGLPADLRHNDADVYQVQTLTNVGLPAGNLTTIADVAARYQQVAEAQLLLAGGTIEGTGAARTYHIGDDDSLAALVEKPDPTGPKGLVAAVRALGGTATIHTNGGTGASDRHNQSAIIDGITDLSYNGRLPYFTDSASVKGTDWYELDFDRNCRFESLVFYEGDIYWGTGGMNKDPKALTPTGGYFTSLGVKIRKDGVWSDVTNLVLSEPLDEFKFFQTITLTFDPSLGDAIQLYGTAGGTDQFTSIVELEAYGQAPEPATIGLLCAGLGVLLRRRRK